jgi:hypothetical protein
MAQHDRQNKEIKLNLVITRSSQKTRHGYISLKHKHNYAGKWFSAIAVITSTTNRAQNFHWKNLDQTQRNASEMTPACLPRLFYSAAREK